MPKQKPKPEVPALQTESRPPPPTEMVSAAKETSSAAPPPKEEPSTVSTAVPVPSVEASSVEAPPDTPTKTMAAQRKALRREKQRLHKLKEQQEMSTAPTPQSSVPRASETPRSLEKASSEGAGAKVEEGKEPEKEMVGPEVEEPKAKEVKAEAGEEKVEEMKDEEEPVRVEVRAPTPVQEVAAEIEEQKGEEVVKNEEADQVEVKDEAQAELRQVIADSFLHKTLWTTDWQGVQLQRCAAHIARRDATG